MSVPRSPLLLHSEHTTSTETYLSVLSHAEELVDAGRKRDARRLLAQLVERKHLDPRIIPVLAGLYIRMGITDRAIRTISNAIAHDSDNADLHNTLGLIFALLGRDADSRSEFLEALRLEPENPEAMRNLAFVLHRAGQRQDAYAMLARCAEATPLSVELRLIFATLLEMDNRMIEAASCYHEVIELSPLSEHVQLASQRLVSIGEDHPRIPFDYMVADLAENLFEPQVASPRWTVRNTSFRLTDRGTTRTSDLGVDRRRHSDNRSYHADGEGAD